LGQIELNEEKKNSESRIRTEKTFLYKNISNVGKELES
jgi:hypothetical protein